VYNQEEEMLKRIIMFALFVSFVAAPAFAAPDRTGKSDFGVNVSAAVPRDSSQDNAVYVGGTYAYGINEWLAIGVEAGRMEFGNKLDLGGGTVVDAGDLQGIPVLGDVILRVPMPDSPFQPYGVVGLGAIFWDFDESALFSANNIDIEVDTSFAIKTGIGFDWFLNDNWILNAEASYVFADADLKAITPVGTATDTTDVDYWMIGGGVKYLFN